MGNTISMQDMRYINLFGKISKIRTRFCFQYNNMIFFCVPQMLVSKAVGPDGKNVKELYNILGRRIKIIAQPESLKELRRFVEDIVEPVGFKEIGFNENEIIITAGNMQSKAALMGRNKKRLLEMKKIIDGFFGKDFRII